MVKNNQNFQILKYLGKKTWFSSSLQCHPFLAGKEWIVSFTKLIIENLLITIQYFIFSQKKFIIVDFQERKQVKIINNGKGGLLDIL